MKRYQISQTLPFSEFSYITESKKMFQYSELGILHSLIPFSELASLFRSKSIHRMREGRPSIFTSEGKIALMILKAKYNLSDRALIERLNSDIYFQIFCDIFISPLAPLRDYKIVSRIRCELSQKLRLDDFQKIVANALRSHISMNDLKVVMSDATCYESYLRFPTNQKLLWECIEQTYNIVVSVSHGLGHRVPRTKYLDVKSAYLSFAKSRRKTQKKKTKITRRLLALLSKLIAIIKGLLHSSKAHLSSNQAKYFKLSKEILKQQQELFTVGQTTSRIVSTSKPYIRPIVRGKEIKSVEFGAKVNSIQVGGFNFIERIDFNAFNEGIRVPQCIDLHKVLFRIKPRFFAGDAIYATNKNRTYCRKNHILTNFVPKGPKPKVDDGSKKMRKELNIARATILEGSFGTEKEYYSLHKIKARTKRNEILWILFGIHTANFSRLARKYYTQKSQSVEIV